MTSGVCEHSGHISVLPVPTYSLHRPALVVLSVSVSYVSVGVGVQGSTEGHSIKSSESSFE